MKLRGQCRQRHRDGALIEPDDALAQADAQQNQARCAFGLRAF
jgi:hypothetical protein